MKMNKEGLRPPLLLSARLAEAVFVALRRLFFFFLSLVLVERLDNLPDQLMTDDIAAVQALYLWNV